jgi:hypothetical protein
MQEGQPDQWVGTCTSGYGVQLRITVDHEHMLSVQHGPFMVTTNRQGGVHMTSFASLRRLACMRKTARKARVILDLFFLVLTLTCLGLALYKSFH